MLAASDGAVVFGTPPTGLNPDLPALLRELRETSQVRLVFASLGGDGDTYTNIAANRAVAVQNLVALGSALGLDGYDIDFEPSSYTVDDRDLVVWLTIELAGVGMHATYCPYRNESWWLDALADVYENLHVQPVRWMNLQCYDGGQSNNPSDWVATVKLFPRPLGVGDPAAFVVPGYWARIASSHPKSPTTSCPATIQRALRAAHTASAICGAFIYNAHDVYVNAPLALCGPGVDVSLTGYANAVRAGLSG